MTAGNKPATPLEERVFLTLLRAAEAHQQVSVKLLKEHGVSPVQYNVLRILRGAGDEGLTCTQIGERLINRDPDITRLLDRMEARGWVRRERQKKDRRVILAFASEDGLRLVNSLDGPIQEMHRRHMGRLSKSKLRMLVGLLEEVRQAAE